MDKSVYRYLDKVCPETADAIAMKNEIIEKLTTFMAPLHKDTTFSIKNVLHGRTIALPFPVNQSGINYKTAGEDIILYDVGDYQTFFSNKKNENLILIK